MLRLRCCRTLTPALSLIVVAGTLTGCHTAVSVANGSPSPDAVRTALTAASQAAPAKKGGKPATCCAVPPRFGASAVAKDSSAQKSPAKAASPAGMVHIPGGEFTMGSDAPDAEPQERPAHRVRVSPFWMDATDVTNAQFRKFVQATGYVTTAERPPDWEEMKKQLPPGTPKPSADKLVAASLVFTPPSSPVPLDDPSAWWSWKPGANWKHPEGPGSSIEGKDNYPVVQVSWDDAVAYTKWAGKRLPTEAEWEFAARGGMEGKRFSWGDAPLSEEKPQCNTWQGHFPDKNTNKDGFLRSSPVRSFPANGYGLYDMAGNVWQWCADWYRTDAYAAFAAGGAVADPQSPSQSYDPAEPYTPKRVTRGGSFLCNASYCASYRVSARRGTSPDSSLAHMGFRCVMSIR